MSSVENNFCSECGNALRDFEKNPINQCLDGTVCSGCALQKQKEKIFNESKTRNSKVNNTKKK